MFLGGDWFNRQAEKQKMMNDTAYYRATSSTFNKIAWAFRRSFLGQATAPLIAQSIYKFLQTRPELILKNESLRRLGDKAQLWAVLDPRVAAIPIGFGPLRGFSILNDPSPHFPTFRVLGIEEVMNQVIFERIIRPGDVVYDLGANVGVHALLFSRLCGPGGRVYAFEPWPENIEKLNANLRLNKIQNVEVVPCAVSSRSGLAAFRTGPDSSQGKLVDDSNEAERHRDLEVQVFTLDDFAAQAQRRPPTLLKIDIEGGEGEALRGARRVLREFRPMVICEIHDGTAAEVVRSVLGEADYEFFVLERGFRVVPTGESLPPWCHTCACPREEVNKRSSILAV